MHPKYLTKHKPIKETLLHAGESTTASGLQKQYPHPFLTPSLYSPHPLSKERWGYSKRGVRDRDIFPYWFSSKIKLISTHKQVNFDPKSICFFLEFERPPPRLEYPLTGVRKSLGGRGPRSAVN